MDKKEAYSKYLKSGDWQRKRKQKLNRSGGKKRRCAFCASEENLDIHHLNYKDLYSVEQNDLRILCRTCHETAHRLMKEGRIFFRSTDPNSRYTTLRNAVKKARGLSRVNCFEMKALGVVQEKLL